MENLDSGVATDVPSAEFWLDIGMELVDLADLAEQAQGELSRSQDHDAFAGYDDDGANKTNYLEEWENEHSSI